MLVFHCWTSRSVLEILALRTGPTMAINRVRPRQLQQERERIFRRVRELNHVGVDEVSVEDHAADVAGETRSPDSTSYGLDVNYQDVDDSDYAGWLGRLATWLAELYRVAQRARADSA